MVRLAWRVLRIDVITGVLLLGAAQPGVADSALGAESEHVLAAAARSGVNVTFMDPQVSPRADLFRHANGTWLHDTPIPSDRSRFGIDQITQDRTELQLRQLVEDLDRQPEAAADPDKARIALLYRDFMDEARVDAAGLQPLQPLLATIDAVHQRTQLGTLMGQLSQAGVNLPFDVMVAQDEQHADTYRVHIAQSTLSLPDRDYYLDHHDPRFKRIRESFLRYAEQQMHALGDARAAQDARSVLDFETRLSKIQWTRVDNRDPQKIYNPRSLDELKRSAPHLAWSDWFVAIGLPLDPGTLVIGQPSYVHAVDHLLQVTPLPVVKTWLRWQVLRAYAPYLDARMAQRHFDFESGSLLGTPEQRPRWKRGLSVVEEAMGDALGRLYVERYFPPSAKAHIQNVVDHLIAAYADSIDHLEWLDPETRAEAKAKLAKIHPKLGYPEHWRDYTGLTLVPGDLLGNVQRARQFEARRNTAKFGHPVDRDEWDMTPQTVNAYYNPSLNEIVFPAAQLQAPYFDAEADDAANYGDIGFVIGHELSHAFDDEGSQFDGDGNLRDWWTPADHARFAERTRALVAQYDAVVPVPGLHVNGALTLGENIADNAGLTIAWKAYLASLQGRAPPVVDGLSAAQRFYISYAQSWMGKAREAELVRDLKSDPHAPVEVRTNLAVRNQDAFHLAFGTRAGDPLWLAPTARVHLW